MIDDGSFCRCRGHSCVQGVRVIDDLFVLWMSWSFLCSWSSVRMIDDCLFCRCRGLSCVQGVRMIHDCSFC